MARVAKGYRAFKLPNDYYHPQLLREALQFGTDTESPEEAFRKARAEYGRLRKVAQLRLSALEKSGRTWLKAYQENVGKFYGLGRISRELTDESLEAITYLLPEVERFLATRTTTVSGSLEWEREILAGLREKGYDFVTSDNFEYYVQYMEAARVSGVLRMYGSKTVAQTFEAMFADRKELTREELDEYMRNASQKTYRTVLNADVRGRISSGAFRTRRGH